MFSLFNAFRKSPQKASPSATGTTSSGAPSPGPDSKAKRSLALRLDNVYEGGRGYSTGRLPPRKGKEKRKALTPKWETNTQNDLPLSTISAVSTYEDYVAIGDEGGMTHVMQMKVAGGPTADPNGSSMTVGELEYRFSSRQQCYVPQIDPLDSSEISPTINALSFLPSVGPRPLLLTTNGQTPKLYKLVQLEPPMPDCSVKSFLGTGALPRLTEPSSECEEEWSLQLVSRYASPHESEIVSLTPLGVGGDQFVTADFFAMRLWCTEYPDTSVETFSLLALGEEPTEAIQTTHGFPQCPSILFAVTSGGRVHLLDTRQSLQWGRRNGVTLDFFADVDHSFPPYNHSMLTDCALSPTSTNLIAARDFTTVALMDLRRSGRVRQWDLHPHLNQSHVILSQMGAYSERFQLQFINATTLITGGLNHHIYTISTNAQSEGMTSGSGYTGAAEDNSYTGVKMFDLPSASMVHTTGIQGAASNPLSDDHEQVDDAVGWGGGRLPGYGEALQEPPMRPPSNHCVTLGGEEPCSVLEDEEEREVQWPWATVVSRPVYSGDRATFFVSSGEKLVQLSCKNE